jgi:hypothetical protein
VFESYEHEQGGYTDAEYGYLDYKLTDGVWKKYDAMGREECSN